MAKGEFHIGPNGPGNCEVDPSKPNSKGCPFGGKTGSEDHFGTIEEAATVYAKKMEEEHGLFNTAPAKPSDQPKTLSPFLQRQYTKTVEELVADKTYGISKDPKLGYVADDSEGLRRFAEELEEKSDGHLSIDVVHEADTDDEVVRNVVVPELGLDIENQNFEEDVREYQEYNSEKRANNAAYWRDTM